MNQPRGVALVTGNNLVVFSERDPGPVSLDEVSGRIVMHLHNTKKPMTGAQLARELKATDSSITKAADRLVKMGILRRERSEIARNVKVYYLLIRVVDGPTLAQIERRVPPIVRQLLLEAFGGEEKMALVFADQLMDYIEVLPKDKQGAVLQAFLSRVRENETRRSAEAAA
ncbi:MAG: MarR family transcriptional regulator [Nitrososphaerota archaeon]|nr:MarR family transcriptional regulator [Nitrososphaerota archaeon]